MICYVYFCLFEKQELLDRTTSRKDELKAQNATLQDELASSKDTHR